MAHWTKRAIGLLVSLVTLGLAVWREMEFLAITALVLAVVMIYLQRAARVAARLEAQISRLQGAKVRDLEITLGDLAEDRALDLGGAAGRTLSWDAAMLMLSISLTGRHRLAPGGQRELARRLRGLGLVTHDAATMGESDFITFTPLGEVIGSSIRERLGPGTTAVD